VHISAKKFYWKGSEEEFGKRSYIVIYVLMGVTSTKNNIQNWCVGAWGQGK
jgi:hypothetical protein